MKEISIYQNETMRAALTNSKLQVFEVKQMAELEDQFKNECKRALYVYRNWQKQYQAETDAVELLYGQLKGIILRRYAENAVQAYWVIRQDFRAVFSRYINNHAIYQPNERVKKRA